MAARPSNDLPRIGSVLVTAVSQLLAPALFRLGIGEDIGTRSAQSPSLFTPFTFTFAVWSVIYPAMLVYAVFQAMPSRHGDSRLCEIGWWTVLAMTANTAWAVIAQVQGINAATVAIIFVMLAALIRAFLGLYRAGSPSWIEEFLVILPVSLFAG